VGLRRAHWGDLQPLLAGVDWLEIVSENFMCFGGEPLRVLDEVKERRPVVPHGVNLSLGGPDPLSGAYLSQLAALRRRVGAPFVSDHLSFGAAGGLYAHDLLPLPHNLEMADIVAQRAREVADAVGCPFVVENVSAYAVMPGSEMDECSFLSAVTERGDCGILLDVNNIFVNAHNLRLSAADYIDRAPLERVVQVHLAGHREEGDVLIDDHAHRIRPEVWELYARLIGRAGWLIPTLIEWDHDVPPVSVLLSEVQRARDVAHAALALRENRP
jgi:hypothetical protein